MRTHRALILVLLLLTATSISVVHWHKDFQGQRCELCNVRQQPAVSSPVAGGPAIPIEADFVWHAPEMSYEPAVVILGKPSRAPPQVALFTF